MFMSDRQVKRTARRSSPIFFTPDRCSAISGYACVYTRSVSSVDSRMRILPMRASLAGCPAPPLLPPPRWQLSKTPMVMTVQGSNTSHVYCSFHVGAKLPIMVRVRTHFWPYLATQYASVVPRPSRVFMGCSPAAPRMPISSTPTGGFHSWRAVGRVSLMYMVDSSMTW
uniref:Uncharacterized protein n=1 Tax=Zea mays TaxID=4577 RepID=B7ZZ48_MAIZE|nr:unknown [Zea mays]ACR36012.1 unknown [Zea mays]